jgi:Phosphotransferase enzyme family
MTSTKTPHVRPLSPREVFLLLSKRDLLDASSFISDSVRVVAASHRNHSYIIESENGPSYFLKQGVSDSTIISVRREATFYEAASRSFRAFQKHMPGFVCFVPECFALVLELVRRAAPMNHSTQRTSSRPYSSLGVAMALLHSKSTLVGVKADHQPSPTILRVGDLSPADLKTISAAGVELIRTIQSFPDFESVLTSAFERSSERCLTHNDFKSSNCLVGQSSRAIIIDWEFAALGDPAWDVGCVLADILATWLFSMPLGSQVAVQLLPTVAARPLRVLHPNIRSFWLAYSDKRELRGDRRAEFLLRATKCAGLKLSQLAFEICQNATSLSATELFLMQTSWNILRRPVEALVRLFGIQLEHSWSNENRAAFDGATQ